MTSSLAVLRSSNCFEQIVTLAPLALAILDEERPILYANARAETLFGYTCCEMLGQDVRLLVAHEAMDWDFRLATP